MVSRERDVDVQMSRQGRGLKLSEGDQGEKYLLSSAMHGHAVGCFSFVHGSGS